MLGAALSPVRALSALIVASALVGGLTACGAFSTATARAEAKDALGCSALDGLFALPHRYGNVRPRYEVYRGCGKYAVLQCTHTTARSSCVTVEVLDAKAAEAAPPMSFPP